MVEQEREELGTGAGLVHDFFEGAELGDGEGAVERADLVADGAGEGGGTALGADEEVGEARGRLEGGAVELGAGGAVEAGVLDIGDHADDGAPGGGGTAAGSHTVADGGFVGPVGAGEGLVDDEGEGGVGAVAVVEKAAFDEAGADGFEVAAGDGVPVVDVLDGAAGLGDEAFDRGVVGVDRAVRGRPLTTAAEVTPGSVFTRSVRDL